MAERKPQKQKPSRKEKLSNFVRSPLFKVLLSVFLFFFISGSAIFLYFYVHYSRIIDKKLTGEIFKNTAQIYAAPFRIYAGQKLTTNDVAARLQRAGFDTTDKGDDGVYEVSGNRITIKPRTGDVMRLDFGRTTLTKIVKPGGSETTEAWLHAELVTNLYDQ